MKRIIGILLFSACTSLAAQNVPDTAEFAAAEAYLLAARKSMVDNNLALNPVTDFDCADPSVVKIDDWFYCFATGYPIKIYRSKDLCSWEYYRNMFPGPSPDDPYGDGKKDPMKTGATTRINYWAPSPALIKGKVVVYLTLFVSMDNDRQVVCVADDIDGEFRYVNTLNVGTPEHPTPQDGQYFLDDDGRHYLVYGDVNSKGNFVRELAPDGLKYKKGSKPAYITQAYEGGYIYKMNGKYYYFCSKGFYNNADYLLHLHYHHRTRMISPSTRYQTDTMRMHYHVHSSLTICKDFSIMTSSVEQRICSVGFQNRHRVAPSFHQVI